MVATVSQQLREMCARSPQLWEVFQQEFKEELKAAKKDAKDARKGTHTRSLSRGCGDCALLCCDASCVGHRSCMLDVGTRYTQCPLLAYGKAAMAVCFGAVSSFDCSVWLWGQAVEPLSAAQALVVLATIGVNCKGVSRCGC